VVTPHVLGEVPTETPTLDQSTDRPENNTSTPQKVVCYVLQNYSRSNALVVDGETRRLQLAPALDPLVIGANREKAAILFLQHQDENNYFNPPEHAFPPRLLRLIESLDQDSNLDIELIPVTVLWGRSTDK
jgi:glycerol-3-phosphate O-acyltransferase